MLKVPLVVFAVAVALVSSAAAFAAVKTTGPGSRLDVTVNMFDTRHDILLMTQSDYKGGLELYMTDWIDVTRGEVARFTIYNKGKKLHNFKVFGKVRTKPIKPGRTATFIVPLLKRGVFPYMSTLNANKGLKGIFTVN
jgi:hypothetical protein